MTYEPIPYAQPMGPPPIENNRRGGLIGFGVVSIIIGSLAGCMTIAGAIGLIMGMAMMRGQMDMGISDVVIGLGVYVVAAVLFVWAGVDSIRCKRWVRQIGRASCRERV